MFAQFNSNPEKAVVLNPSQFTRAPDTGLTRDTFSEFALNQQGRHYCVNLIVGFLSNITHYLSSAQYALECWQPKQVLNAADTMWSECITVGGERAADLARALQEHAEAGRPREAREAFAQLRAELVFVWEDLQLRLEALRSDIDHHMSTSDSLV